MCVRKTIRLTKEKIAASAVFRARNNERRESLFRNFDDSNVSKTAVAHLSPCERRQLRIRARVYGKSLYDFGTDFFILSAKTASISSHVHTVDSCELNEKNI